MKKLLIMGFISLVIPSIHPSEFVQPPLRSQAVVELEEALQLIKGDVKKLESKTNVTYWVRFKKGGTLTCVKSKCINPKYPSSLEGPLCWMVRPRTLLTVLPASTFYMLENLYVEKNQDDGREDEPLQ